MLLDPDVSVVDIVERRALARDVGLLVRIESDGFDTVGRAAPVAVDRRPRRGGGT